MLRKHWQILLFVLGSLLADQIYAQSTLDSLKSVDLEPYTTEVQLATYEAIISKSLHNEDSTLKYANIMLDASKGKSAKFHASACAYIGQSYSARGDYETALKFLLEGMELEDQLTNKESLFLKMVLAGLYGNLEEMDRMRELSLSIISDELKNGSEANEALVAMMYNNLAQGFYQNSFFDSALFYFQMAEQSCSEASYPGFGVFVRGNIGMVYNKIGRYSEAVPLLDSAIVKVRENGDVLSLATFLMILAETKIKLGDLNSAEQLLAESYAIGKANSLKEQIRDASQMLSELYQQSDNYKLGLNFYKEYRTYEDSITNLNAVKNIANMRKEYEIGQKQVEVNLLTTEKKNQQFILMTVVIFAILLMVLAAVIFKYYKAKARVNAQLEELNATKDKFFSIISHDLRGPISSFMGISRIIKFMVKAKETEQLLEVADDIEDSVDKLSTLLDNLLNWAMQQQGQIPYSPEQIDLNKMAIEIASTLKMMAEGKQIKLITEVPENLTIWADRNTTMTILRNITSNALKFTPEQGQVTIAANSEKDSVTIRISDTGVGMAQEKLNSLFELGDRKSTYGTAGEKGLGLGLQLVKEFVLLNKGEISVESEEGSGTRFLVQLPTA
ncbi:MAG: signal transduction histidine kinase [Marinoscillum sp.]|jgi:signal transduction histidine kinase